MKSQKLKYRITHVAILMFSIGMTLNFVLSCTNKKQMPTDADQEKSLLIKYTSLQDSVDSNWQIMIADDDEKHQFMKRLLLEVSYTNNYDKGRFKELNELVDQLKSMRYDQQSMRNSDLIDAYDSATFDLSDQILVFARNHPRYEDLPLMAELIDDINRKNNYILMHRIHYDNWVKELNSFKLSKRKKLLKSEPEMELKSNPLFELPS